MKKSLFLLLGCIAALTQTQALAETNYPQRTVTLVVPTAAAGGTDIIARMVAERLSRSLKQSFVVENKPGANGILGVNAIAQAKPDGYKLLLTYAASLAVNPSLYKKLPFDPIKDLIPIAQVGLGGTVLVVNSDSPVKTLEEFISYVKERPEQLNYCSWGTGSGGHLTMENLKQQTGMVMTHIPYKGGALCIQSVLGKQVDAAFADVSSIIELARGGKLRMLAIGDASRNPSLPDVPTLTEAGYPFDVYSWYGLLAPAGTPPEIIKKLNTAVNDMLMAPENIKFLNSLNLYNLPTVTPQQFAQTIQNDTLKWAAIIKKTGLKPE
ncbi:hypothetical protein AwPolaro_06680 [Polaromonas sp.]|nr:hypothetical protein AwPolaro_06680 [Polaromonas sp.]